MRGRSGPAHGSRHARPPSWRPRWSSALSSPALRVLLLAGVVAEGARRRELAELVSHHRLGDVHGHVLATVVDGDRVTHHLRDDRGTPRPGLDDLLLVVGVQA